MQERGTPLVWNGKSTYFFNGTIPVNHKDARPVYDNRGNHKGYALKDGTPLRAIRDTFKPSWDGSKTRHECGARCLSSKGSTCECSCGGANHGAGC